MVYSENDVLQNRTMEEFFQQVYFKEQQERINNVSLSEKNFDKLFMLKKLL